MKYRIVLVIIFLSSTIYGQDFHSEFLIACESNDTIKQLSILENWESADPANPELFTSRLNYHFSKSQNEVIELRTGEPEGDSFIIQDSTGQTAGFLGSRIFYDSLEIQKAFDYIDKGIEQNPYRLDMRFGKIYVFGQLSDWENFTKEIIKTIKVSVNKESSWLWLENEPQEEDNEFMLSAIQDYQLQLYNTENDSLLLNMREIANTVLEHYPNHIESLSNVAITYTLLGEFNKALGTLLKAEAINPQDHIVIANIAHTYKLLERKEESIIYYEKLSMFDIEGVKEFAKQQITLLKKE